MKFIMFVYLFLSSSSHSIIIPPFHPCAVCSADTQTEHKCICHGARFLYGIEFASLFPFSVRYCDIYSLRMNFHQTFSAAASFSNTKENGISISHQFHGNALRFDLRMSRIGIISFSRSKYYYLDNVLYRIY